MLVSSLVLDVHWSTDMRHPVKLKLIGIILSISLIFRCAIDPKLLRPRCFKKRCNGGVSIYLHAREIVFSSKYILGTQHFNTKFSPP